MIHKILKVEALSLNLRETKLMLQHINLIGSRVDIPYHKTKPKLEDPSHPVNGLKSFECGLSHCF